MSREHLAVVTDQRFYVDDHGTVSTKGGLCVELLRGYSARFHTTVFARVFRDDRLVRAGEQFSVQEGPTIIAIPSWSGLSALTAMPALRRFFNAQMGRFSAAVLRVAGQASITAYPACIKHGVPYIVHRIGEPRNRHELSTKLGHSLLARIVADRILAWADRHEALMVRSAAFSTAVSHTLARRVYGTDYAIADTSIDSIDVMRVRSSVAKPARLLFVGRLVDVKNPYAVLRAGEIVRRSHPIEIRVVGDGPLDAALRDEAMALGIDGATVFTGHIYKRDLLNDEYRNADIMILPSHSEGLPLVIIEAMAQGVPVIATDVGGIPDIVKNGVNGFLLTDASPEAIAREATKLLEDHVLYQSISANALRTACEYTVSSQAARLERVVSEIMRSGRLGAGGPSGNGVM